MVCTHLIERKDAEVRWHEEPAARIPQDRRQLPGRCRRPAAAPRPWPGGGRPATTPGPDAVARAFSHSAQLALLANLGFVALALVLVLALPRTILGHP
jgi:hypothetical protein